MKKKETKNKVVNPNRRANTWNILDKTVSVAPLVGLGCFQWKEYFATSNGLSNGLGIGLLGVFVVLIMSKKTAVLKGCKGFIAVFVICFLLRTILNDLVLISGCACAGQLASATVTKPKQLKWERIREKHETAEITSTYMSKAINNKRGEDLSGRV